MISPKGSTRHGFSLIEVMVVVVIVGIAIMSFVGLSTDNLESEKLSDALNDIKLAIRHGRNQAIMRREEVLMRIDREKQTYSY